MGIDLRTSKRVHSLRLILSVCFNGRGTVGDRSSFSDEEANKAEVPSRGPFYFRPFLSCLSRFNALMTSDLEACRHVVLPHWPPKVTLSRSDSGALVGGKRAGTVTRYTACRCKFPPMVKKRRGKKFSLPFTQSHLVTTAMAIIWRRLDPKITSFKQRPYRGWI